MKKFPVYNNHADVKCFSCKGLLHREQPIKSTYPKHSGEYVKYCRSCGYYTWYDIKSENEEE